MIRYFSFVFLLFCISCFDLQAKDLTRYKPGIGQYAFGFEIEKMFLLEYLKYGNPKLKIKKSTVVDFKNEKSEEFNHFEFFLLSVSPTHEYAVFSQILERNQSKYQIINLENTEVLYSFKGNIGYVSWSSNGMKVAFEELLKNTVVVYDIKKKAIEYRVKRENEAHDRLHQVIWKNECECFVYLLSPHPGGREIQKYGEDPPALDNYYLYTMASAYFIKEGKFVESKLKLNQSPSGRYEYDVYHEFEIGDYYTIKDNKSNKIFRLEVGGQITPDTRTVWSKDETKLWFYPSGILIDIDEKTGVNGKRSKDRVLSFKDDKAFVYDKKQDLFKTINIWTRENIKTYIPFWRDRISKLK